MPTKRTTKRTTQAFAIPMTGVEAFEAGAANTKLLLLGPPALLRRHQRPYPARANHDANET
jgi:hypothetical protein